MSKIFLCYELVECDRGGLIAVCNNSDTASRVIRKYHKEIENTKLVDNGNSFYVPSRQDGEDEHYWIETKTLNKVW
jgi:hypothetical protein